MRESLEMRMFENGERRGNEEMAPFYGEVEDLLLG